MECYTFKKEASDRWYIDLPKWEGKKEDLEMVEGADILMDIIAQDESVVDVTISTSYFPEVEFTLDFRRFDRGGAWYQAKGQYHTFEVWLCEVTEFLFGNFPNKLYICKTL